MDDNLLPVAQSESELFLDYIARNSNDLSKLPVPYSRIELFLDYIARNMNVSSGGNGNSNGNITLPLEIKDVNGLQDVLDKKFDSLDVSDNGISFKSGNTELSSIPMATTAEIELILQNLT